MFTKSNYVSDVISNLFCAEWVELMSVSEPLTWRLLARLCCQRMDSPNSPPLYPISFLRQKYFFCSSHTTFNIKSIVLLGSNLGILTARRRTYQGLVIQAKRIRCNICRRIWDGNWTITLHILATSESSPVYLYRIQVDRFPERNESIKLNELV